MRAGEDRLRKLVVLVPLDGIPGALAVRVRPLIANPVLVLLFLKVKLARLAAAVLRDELVIAKPSPEVLESVEVIEPVPDGVMLMFWLVPSELRARAPAVLRFRKLDPPCWREKALEAAELRIQVASEARLA